MKLKLPFLLAFLSLYFIATSQNIIVNGDFESGGNGVGFNLNGAGYNLISGPFSGITSPGDYAFVTNPLPMNTTSFISTFDHTTGTGTGKMMAFDGTSAAGSQLFWRLGNTGGGACALTIGNNYQFSYWIRSISTTVTGPTTQSDIGIQFTGASNIVLASGVVIAPLPALGWQKVVYTFKATAACTTIELWNNNQNMVGNDFAVDDFELVQLPTAQITGATTVCQNAASPSITFTGANGIAPYTFTYNINGGPTQTVTTTLGNSISVPVPTSTAITYNYNLMSVSYGSTIIYSQVQVGTVAVNISRTIAIANMVLSNPTACYNMSGPTITFTGAAGSAPYTFTYNIGTAPSQTITTVVGNSITIPVQTTTAGVINYYLTEVSSSANACPTIMFSTVAVAIRPELKVTVNDALNCIQDNTIAKVTAAPEFPGTYSYLWVVPTGASNPGNVSTFNTTVAGNYQVVMTDILTGCKSSAVTSKVAFISCIAGVTIATPATVCALGDCTNLLADYPKYYQTTDYLASQIPYVQNYPLTGGTLMAPSDDTWSSTVALPFPVCFYGVNYNNILVGTNGVVTFDTVNQSALGTCNGTYNTTIPNIAFPIRNAIYGVFQDTNISAPPVTNPILQNVNYSVISTGANAAPNRVFVVNFSELPQYQCNAGVGLQTSQIVIHETTNIIEVLVNKRASCTTWNSGNGLIGLQNQAGTLASVPPGRNTGAWSTTNEAWRFMPYGKQSSTNIPLLVPTTIAWTQPPGTAILSTNDSIAVCPTGPETYLSTVTYQTCGGPVVVSNAININLAPLPTATMTLANATPCFKMGITTVTFTGAGGIAPYTFTYHIDGGAPQSITTVSGNSITIPFNAAAAGTVTYYLTQVKSVANNCPTNVLSSVSVTPLVVTVNNQVNCLDDLTAVMVATPLIVGSYSYAWIGPVGFANPGNVSTFPTSVAGNYSVIITNNATGCTSASITGVFSYIDCIVGVTINTPLPVCDLGDCTNLHADYPIHSQTTDYTVSKMLYNPSFPFTGGTTIPVTSDDSWSPYVNLPFNICFFGVNYNKVLVGTNGVVTFDVVTQAPLGYCNWPYTATIPNPAFPIRNAIYGVYQDTNIAAPPVTNAAVQNVNYYVLSTGANVAPNRVFVANFNELPQFWCNGGVGFQTSQIVIHETTGIIDIFVSKRTSCTSWNSGSGLIGIQNQAGTIAKVPLGRNTGTWSAFNEAYRFMPSGLPVPTTIEWTKPPSVAILSTTANLNVCPIALETYLATVKYNTCSGPQTVTKTVVVNVAPPLAVLSPVTLPICDLNALPYSINIDQNTHILNGSSLSDYNIKYYENLIDAQNDTSNNITNLSTYSVTTIPKTIYVRIEDLNVTGCSNVRSFVINTVAPSMGSFVYPNNPYCSTLTTPQPILPSALTSGGTFTSSPIGLSLNASNGEIIPSSSLVGTYTVIYQIPATITCPAYQTQTTLDIVNCGCTIVASNTGPICPGGTFDLSATTVAGATYAWTGPGAFSSTSQSPLNIPAPTGTPPFIYQVTATGPGGICSISTTVVVNPLPTVTVNNATICAGQSSTITATPGIAGSYNYNWTVPATVTNPANVSGFSTTVAGIYTVVITNTSTLCASASANGTVTINPLPVVNVNSPTVCAGQSAIITATPANPGSYNYAWTVPTGAPTPINTASFSTTIAGTYSVIITNTVTLCSSASATGTVTLNPLPTVTVNSPVVCAGTPAIVTATPGTAAIYSYAWTVPSGASAPGNVASFSTNTAGIYSVIITNITTNCISASAGGTVTINAQPTVIVSSNKICAGSIAPVSAIPGIPATYSYAWTVPSAAGAPGNVATFNTSTPGVYSVIITDVASTCVSASGSTTLVIDPLPTVTVNNPTVCAGTPATLRANPGLPGTYTYNWTIPIGAASPGNVAVFSTTTPGTYTVVITNTTTSCSSLPASSVVTINPLPTVTVNNISLCAGAASIVTATPGTAGTYSYTWTVPSGVSPPANVASFSTSTAGIYTASITNASSCSSLSASGTATVNPIPVVTVNSQTVCAGTSAVITATPSSAGIYSYNWTVPSGAAPPGNVPSFSTAVAGTYSVIITDLATTCVSVAASGTVTVNPLPVANVNSPSTCAGILTNIAATPTTPGTYTYSWTVPASASLPGNVGSFATATAGNYTVIVTNTATSCSSASAAGTLTVNALPTVTVNSPSTCTGIPTNIAATAGIAGTYSYVWTIPATATQHGNVSNFATAVAGTYTVIITNTTTNCVSAPASGLITVTPLPTVLVNSSTTCAGINTTVTATPGSPGTYSYAWTVPAGATPPGNVATFSTATAGTYNVIIRNTITNCSSAAASGIVSVNPLPTVTLNSPSTCAGTATNVLATPGTPGPYSYAWTVPTGAAAPGNVSTFSTLTAGNYSVVITHTTTHCVSAMASGTVSAGPLPTVSVNSSVICQGQSANVTATPGTAGTYSYAWTVPIGAVAPGNVSGFTTTIAGTYTVKITNITTTCVSLAASGTVTVNPLPTVVVTSPSVCDGTSATVQASPGSAGTYSYSWTVPAGAAAQGNVSSFATTIEGIYSVTITNTTTGCTSLPANGLVTIYPLPAVSLNSPTICSGVPEIVMANPTPSGLYSYVWTVPTGALNPGNQQSFPASVPGTYSVIVTNASNCSSSSYGFVTATSPPLSASATASSYFSDGQIISVEVNPAGTYEYQIDNGPFQASNQFINITSGWHSIIVKNECGTLSPVLIRIIDYPKFFTPDGDGYNDTWNIRDLSDQPASVIYIYDRYGKLLKQISPLGSGWDGLFNGKQLPSTDYWFKVFFSEQGTDRVFKSHFSLKR